MDELDAGMPSLLVLIPFGFIIFWGAILLFGVLFSDKKKEKHGKDSNSRH